jgi:type IV secretory pathway VirJ component
MPLKVERASPAGGDSFVIWYSGVGGLGPADRGVMAGLATRGLPTVGVDSALYFTRRRSPQTAAADLASLIERYGGAWGRPGVVLVGYSFGGAALPLIIPELPAQDRARIRLVVLIAPSEKGELVMRPWTLFDIFQPSATPLGAEAAGLEGLPSLCIADPHDGSADCAALPAARQVAVSGGHRLQGSYDVVAGAIADAALPGRLLPAENPR